MIKEIFQKVEELKAKLSEKINVEDVKLKFGTRKFLKCLEIELTVFYEINGEEHNFSVSVLDYNDPLSLELIEYRMNKEVERIINPEYNDN